MCFPYSVVNKYGSVPAFLKLGFVPRIFIFLSEVSLNTLLKSSNKLAIKLDCKSTYSFNDLYCL